MSEAQGQLGSARHGKVAGQQSKQAALPLVPKGVSYHNSFFYYTCLNFGPSSIVLDEKVTDSRLTSTPNYLLIHLHGSFADLKIRETELAVLLALISTAVFC